MKTGEITQKIIRHLYWYSNGTLEDKNGWRVVVQNINKN